MDVYFKTLERSFGGLVVSSYTDPSGRRLRTPGKLAVNLARNGTAPLTLLEMDRFLGIGRRKPEGGAPGEAEEPMGGGAGPSFGLRCLLLAPLCSENRGALSRGRFDFLNPFRAGRKGGGSSSGDLEGLLSRQAGPLIAALEGLGVGEVEARAFGARVGDLASEIAEESLPGGGKEEVRALREALLSCVFKAQLSLLLWSGGTPLSLILRLGDELRALELRKTGGDSAASEALREISAVIRDLLGRSFGADAFREALERLGGGDLSSADDPEPDFPGAEGRGFDRRFAEKIVLILDSYLEYRVLKKSRDEGSLESLRKVAQTLRYGMKEDDLPRYALYLQGGGKLSREEWLAGGGP
ncbi:MAG: hypothetical protein LBR53_08565 [Deltaproteobacteria bacterium]|jgi:hypothetical protein|nr:hypothetical protein [Deltaproteobacteria bacterium]